MSLSVQVTLPNGTQYTQPTGIFYNNEFHASMSGKTFSTVDPSTAKEICVVQSSQIEDVNAAVQAAKVCFNSTMQDMAPDARGLMLSKFADLVEKEQELLAAIESMDGGKPYSHASSYDLVDLIGVFRYYAGWADKVQGKTIDTGHGRLTYTLHDPIGVCGQIIPWNFPLSMFAWKVAPAIACGNTVVLKPAEQTPLSVLYLCNIMKKVFPPGAVNIIPGYGDPAGSSLVSHRDVRKVAFTGSTLVGRKIMKSCADSEIIKKVTLELGGKSPVIVLEDADLEQAVKWVHTGMFFNQSQVCCATTRILVQASIYDKFSELFVKFTKEKANHQVGMPFDENTFQGPQISQVQHEKILDYIKVGKEEGATVLLDGGRPKDPSLAEKGGYFLDPTIFGSVRPSMRISREEIFGPVAVLTSVADAAEALEFANDSMYGLGAAIFTQNIRKAHTIARKLQAGQVWINSSNDGAPSIPFGGFKSSGIGRELGEYALSNYTEVKAIMVNLGVDL